MERMLSATVRRLLTARENKFMIPADVVANVQESNNLEHALLVLTKIGYAKIPVLDSDGRFKGLLSLPMITNQMLGLDGIDTSVLGTMTVRDVMERDVATIKTPYDVEEVLRLLIDRNFLVVVDEKNHFMGIVTRREVMKSVNYMVHTLGEQYSLTPKGK